MRKQRQRFSVSLPTEIYYNRLSATTFV